MAPAPDFTYTGVVITHGYNLDGPEYVRDNRQYRSVTIPASSFDETTHEYTIPASYIDGEVRIEGLFTPSGTVGIGEIRSSGSGQLIGLYSVDGRRLSKVPAKGVYIQNSKKVLY